MKFVVNIFLACISCACMQPIFSEVEEPLCVDPVELKAFFDVQEALYSENSYTPPSPVDESSPFLVTENGLETIQWELELMRHAKHSIELTGFCGGAIFRSMLAIFEEKLTALPDFKVHIITSPTMVENEESKMIASLQKRFPDRFNFIFSKNVVVLLPDLTSIDNHVKVVIVDEKYFTTGGTNKDDALATDGSYYTGQRNYKGGIVGAWLPSGVRDMDIVGFGTLAKTLRLQYYKLYALWLHYNKNGWLPREEHEYQELNHYAPIPSADVAVFESLDNSPRLIHNAKIRMVFSGPMDQPSNNISREYETLIDQAQSRVILANLYWNPADMILKAAMRAVNRGIDLTLFTNGINDLTPKFNDLFAWASRINYVPIFFGRHFHLWDYFTSKKCSVLNTHVFEYHVKDILYHKKVMIVDDRTLLIGSYNLGTKSHKSDYEMVLVIESEQAVQDVMTVLQRDQILSLAVSAEQARDWYFNPITAYLGGTQKSFHGFMKTPFEQDPLEGPNELAKKIKEWNNQNLIEYPFR